MSEAAQKWVYENSAEAIRMPQEEFLAMLRKARKLVLEYADLISQEMQSVEFRF